LFFFVFACIFRLIVRFACSFWFQIAFQCKINRLARGRTNVELREQFILANGVSQSMTPFISKMHHNNSHGGSCKSSCSDLVPQFPSTGPITKVKRLSHRHSLSSTSMLSTRSSTDNTCDALSRLNLSVDAVLIDQTVSPTSSTTRSVSGRGLCKREQLRKDHLSRSTHTLSVARDASTSDYHSQNYTSDLHSNSSMSELMHSQDDQSSQYSTSRSRNSLHGSRSSFSQLNASFAGSTQSSLQKQKMKVRRDTYVAALPASPPKSTSTNQI
jgi:hypothetical protein